MFLEPGSALITVVFKIIIPFSYFDWGKLKLRRCIPDYMLFNNHESLKRKTLQIREIFSHFHICTPRRVAKRYSVQRHITLQNCTQQFGFHPRLMNYQKKIMRLNNFLSQIIEFIQKTNLKFLNTIWHITK